MIIVLNFRAPAMAALTTAGQWFGALMTVGIAASSIRAAPIPGEWQQVQRFSASGLGPHWLGIGMDIDGSRALVGAVSLLDTTSGKAFVFERNAGSWTQHAELVLPPTETASLDFGWSVALSGDTAVVGDYRHRDATGVAVGAAFVFERDTASGIWQFITRFDRTNPGYVDEFGWSVDTDGNRIVVGGHGVDNPGPADGIVHVYERDPMGGWTNPPTLLGMPATPSGYSRFGHSVALDGDDLLVGAIETPLPGRAFVFHWNGLAWTAQEIANPSPQADDQFGFSVALEGGFAVIGAPGRESGGACAPAIPGFAYASRFDPTSSTWGPAQALPRTDVRPYFGVSVAISGERIAVARSPWSPCAPGVDQAYVYAWVDPQWLLEDTLIGCDADPELTFGAFVELEGTSLLTCDVIQQHIYAFEPGSPFESYCPGDGTGAPCPCANPSTPGSKQGCVNSTDDGAHIQGLGTNSVAADDLQVCASLAPANAPALLFSGSTAIAGGSGIVFGDGLRCAGGTVRRLGIRFIDPNGFASWGPGLAGTGQWTAGDTRHLQMWYRDVSGSPCGAMASGHNLSHALRVTFVP